MSVKREVELEDRRKKSEEMKEGERKRGAGNEGRREEIG